jgi:hypothetical protein
MNLLPALLSADAGVGGGARFWSGREDLNLRPLDPQSSALTRLRYAPTARCYIDGSRPGQPAINSPVHALGLAALTGLTGCSLLLSFSAAEQPCTDERECVEGYSCLGELCVEDGSVPTGNACNRDEQCEGDLVCADFICRAGCEEIFSEDDDCPSEYACARARLVSDDDLVTGGACVPADPDCENSICSPTAHDAPRTCEFLNGVVACVESCTFNCPGDGSVCTSGCGLSDAGEPQTCQPVLNNFTRLCVPEGTAVHHDECDFAERLCAPGHLCLRYFSSGSGHCLKVCNPSQMTDPCAGALEWDGVTPIATCTRLNESDTSTASIGICGQLQPL